MGGQMREVSVADNTSLSRPGRGWKIILKLSLNQIGFEYADCSWDLSSSQMKRRSECGNKPESCVQQVERLLA